MSGPQAACGGIGLDATIRGDPRDPRIAWLVDRTTHVRIDLVWPSGYIARFSPSLEIVAPRGAVVLRDGDHVGGGCVTLERGVVLLMPPFQ